VTGSHGVPRLIVGWLCSAVVLALPLVAWSQGSSNELLDFQFDPFSRPPSARFIFKRPPRYEQTITPGGVLVLEFPDTANAATRDKYLRNFPSSYPLESLEVSERADDRGSFLVVRFVTRSGIGAEIQGPKGGARLVVAFGNAAEMRAAPSATTVPAPAEPEQAEPVVEKPPMRVELPDLATGKRAVRAPIAPREEAAPAPEPKEASASEETAPTPPQEPAGATEREPVGKRASWGSFVLPILSVALGIVLLVGVLIGGGFALAWGYGSLRGFAQRRTDASVKKAYDTARQMNHVIAQFRESSEAAISETSERHRQSVELLRRDAETIRDTVASVIAEFERATQSVVLLQEPPRMSAVAADDEGDIEDEIDVGERQSPRPDGDERLVASEASTRAEDRRRSVRDWVTRAAERLQDDPLRGTQAEALARQVHEADEQPLEPFPPGPSEPPTDRETGSGSRTDGAEIAYADARAALAEGRTPLEVAQRTGLSLGEVELIAQLQRMSDGLPRAGR